VDTTQAQTRPCWCGNRRFKDYSPNFVACAECGTLVSRIGLTAEQVQVRDDSHDYYGKEYWLSHQSQGLGLPTIHDRARQDLPGRCIYWLQTLLSCKRPPARVLELGCAHGGLVALLRWAGFDAVGLELSPWVTEFARSAFGIPVLLGPVEDQGLAEGSFDAVVLSDVMEHLPDPVGTLRGCVRLLKPDGALVVQTPEYPDHRAYADLVAAGVPFLRMIDDNVAAEHLYVFSRRSARRLLESLGCAWFEFLSPYFGCDMYFVAARQDLRRRTAEEVAAGLATQPGGRLVQTLLDKYAEAESVRTSWEKAEADRLAQFRMIKQLENTVRGLTAANEHRQEVIRRQQVQLAEQEKVLGWVKRSLPYRLVRFARRRWQERRGRKGAA
jgi:2-polyprenyl-3-methyl-5-hydroxy-6-metoxy-1,4-benzoquinol methylase